MTQGHNHLVTPHRRPLMTLAAGLAALILSGAAFSNAALAQTNPPPQMQPKSQAESDARLKAPIGHRQPRPQDLPPNVVREESRPTINNDRALDDKLQICRPC
jgi:hypothetical protein